MSESDGNQAKSLVDMDLKRFYTNLTNLVFEEWNPINMISISGMPEAVFINYISIELMW